MLKAGDKVYIDGTKEEGIVKEVHPHEIARSRCKRVKGTRCANTPTRICGWTRRWTKRPVLSTTSA
jgi:hypothetical protein